MFRAGMGKYGRSENEAAYDLSKKQSGRYKNRSEVSLWQIENEPFLAFGVCPPISGETLIVRLLPLIAEDTSRLILTTDSGELSTWIPAASRGDVLGRRSIGNFGAIDLAI